MPFACLALATALAGLTACDSPRSQGAVPQPTRSTPATPRVTALPTGAPPATTRPPAPSPSRSFAESTAVPCGGFPTANQVIAVLRRTDVLPSGLTPSVQTQPQCAGDWQFTVVSVPDREPLQVVTRGAPSALQLVTAGTDVCSIPVRTGAPIGIRALANCA